MTRIPEWLRQEHARMQMAFSEDGMTDEAEMVAHLAATLPRLPDRVRTAVDVTARAMVRDHIRDCDIMDLPLEIALALHSACCGELWVEIKRRAAGRKS